MQYLVVFFLILMAIAAAGFLLWVAAVALVRLFAYIAGIAIIFALVTFAAGLVWGTVIPARVIRLSSDKGLRIATPEYVRSGHVFRKGPKGAAEHFGWDRGWPLYVPYQLRFDMDAVFGEVKSAIGRIAGTAWSWWPRWDAWYLRAVIVPLWCVTIGIAVVGLVLGICASTLLWYLLVWMFRLIVTMMQRLVMVVVRARESAGMKRLHAEVRCTRCYRGTEMPSFRCANPKCSLVHRDVSPGPLGLRTRICECGERLPLTVAAATKRLVAVCPFCEKDLPAGSGGRRVAVVPVFGSVGTGKTQFLASAIVAVNRLHCDSATSLDLTALSGEAREFLKVSVANADSGRLAQKTSVSDQPEGYPFLVERPDDCLELHLMDAAGEKFVRAEETRSLGYLDTADSLIFLVDPLTFPEVGDELRRSPMTDGAQVAEGEADDSYGSVVDRLRDSGEDLSRKRLAVVITKADLVRSVLPREPIPDASGEVREWMLAHDGDALVRRAEMDFQHVTYFAVDSTNPLAGETTKQPLRVVDWVVTHNGGPALFGASAAPAAMNE